jgi:hypothetical protein
MSRIGTIVKPFGGDDRTFAMPWRELIELQEARDCGPAIVLARLFVGEWRLEDVREVIRLGLQGGGMTPAEATKLVKIHVEGHPENIGGEDGLLKLAVAILSAALDGAPDEPLGETSAPTQQSESMTFQTERSGSGPSTPSAH